MSDEFTVGPGVAQVIADNNDELRSDEQYVIMTEGHKISRTFGRDAVYYYYEEDNATRRCPF